MKLVTLQDRIQKAEERIAKKHALIAKKTAWIEKKRASLSMMDENTRQWAEFDIRIWGEDIERAAKEIKEIEAALENYKAQLTGAIARERTLTELPESLKAMQEQLVTRWDAYDIERRNRLKAAYRALEWHDFIKKHGRSGYEFKDRTDEQIHDGNTEDAKALILDLIRRVKDHVGEITEWSGIRLEIGNNGHPVLNGYVEGKQGRCRVESIDAGGYNIQRYHIRVLVKDFA